jgi:hypothetical protein
VLALGQLPPVAGSTLGTFTSRDSEVDRRIMLLKRINFIILSGDSDQYVRAMPDIQGIST